MIKTWQSLLTSLAKWIRPCFFFCLQEFQQPLGSTALRQFRVSDLSCSNSSITLCSSSPAHWALIKINMLLRRSLLKIDIVCRGWVRKEDSQRLAWMWECYCLCPGDGERLCGHWRSRDEQPFTGDIGSSTFSLVKLLWVTKHRANLLSCRNHSG